MFTGITQETTTVVSNVDGVLRLSTPAATDNLPLGSVDLRQRRLHDRQLDRGGLVRFRSDP